MSNIIALNVSVGSFTQYPGGTLMLDWLNRSTSGTSSVQIYLVTDEQPSQPASVNFTYSTISEPGPFALEWLRNDTFGKELVDPITGKVFPELEKLLASNQPRWCRSSNCVLTRRVRGKHTRDSIVLWYSRRKKPCDLRRPGRLLFNPIVSLPASAAFSINGGW